MPETCNHYSICGHNITKGTEAGNAGFCRECYSKKMIRQQNLKIKTWMEVARKAEPVWVRKNQ